MYLSLVEHQKTSAVEIKEYFSKFGAMQKKKHYLSNDIERN